MWPFRVHRRTMDWVAWSPINHPQVAVYPRLFPYSGMIQKQGLPWLRWWLGYPSSIAWLLACWCLLRASRMQKNIVYAWRHHRLHEGHGVRFETVEPSDRFCFCKYSDHKPKRLCCCPKQNHVWGHIISILLNYNANVVAQNRETDCNTLLKGKLEETPICWPEPLGFPYSSLGDHPEKRMIHRPLAYPQRLETHAF